MIYANQTSRRYAEPSLRTRSPRTLWQPLRESPRNRSAQPSRRTGCYLDGDNAGSPVVAQAATNILSIVGGKGGVSKTAIATSLAIASHKAGHRTLLIDGDLGLANADIILGVHATGTLADCLFGGLACLSIVSSSWGPDLLPAASGRPQLSELTTEHSDRLIQLLRDLATVISRLLSTPQRHRTRNHRLGRPRRDRFSDYDALTRRR